jgi:hypothetical protein
MSRVTRNGKEGCLRPAGWRLRLLVRSMRVVVPRLRDYKRFFISCIHDDRNRSYFRSYVVFVGRLGPWTWTTDFSYLVSHGKLPWRLFILLRHVCGSPMAFTTGVVNLTVLHNIKVIKGNKIRWARRALQCGAAKWPEGNKTFVNLRCGWKYKV